MENKLNVYAKLQKARFLLQQGGLKKTGSNAGRYTYFELQDFLPQINEIFDKLGLFSMVNINEERGNIIIINTEDVDDRLMFTVPSCEVKLMGGGTQIQALGAQQTYIKRYLYTLALEVSEVDVIDSTEQSEAKDKSDKNKSKGKDAKSDGETLESVKETVVAKCKELSDGGKRAEVQAIVKKHHPMNLPNPSSIKDIKLLKNILEELNKI